MAGLLTVTHALDVDREGVPVAEPHCLAAIDDLVLEAPALHGVIVGVNPTSVS